MSVPVLPAYVLPGQSYVNQEGTTVHVPPDPSGRSDLTTQLTGNLSGALKGELPADVKQLLQQEAAQNAVSSGVSGSQFANYQGLRTLGLTSLNRMQNAENSLVNPLLGYHPLQILPRQEPGAPAPPSNIHWGGTAPTSIGPTGTSGSHPTLPNYQQGGGGAGAGPNYNNVAMDLVAKYGSGAGAGGGSSWNTTTNWNAGGDWNAGANAPWNNPGGGSANAGFGAGGGSTYFGNPDEAAALQEQQQNLIGAGFNPVDFGYQNSDLNAAMAEQAQNLQYSDLNPTDFGYG